MKAYGWVTIVAAVALIGALLIIYEGIGWLGFG
jgi:hypothetical protein